MLQKSKYSCFSRRIVLEIVQTEWDWSCDVSASAVHALLWMPVGWGKYKATVANNEVQFPAYFTVCLSALETLEEFYVIYHRLLLHKS
jgi:hypothetical protein